MPGRPLAAVLSNLLQSLKAEAEGRRASGTLTKITRTYSRGSVTKLDYLKGSISYSTSYDYVTSEEWDATQVYACVTEWSRHCSEFAEASAEMVSKYSRTPAAAEFLLNRFCQVLVPCILDGAQPVEITNSIVTLVGDLEDNPVTWSVQVWLDGIWLEDESHSLPDGLTLRRPKPTDFQSLTPAELLPARVSPNVPTPGSAMLEFGMRARTQAEVSRRVDGLLSALRLFRLGSVAPVRVIMNPDSFTRSGQTSSPSIFSMICRYGLSPDDAGPIAECIRRIGSALASSDETGASGSTESVLIAFQRFNESLLQPGATEAKITSAITCLEALFLKSAERSELSHRLGQRLAILLRCASFQPMEVYRKVAQAYELRSTYIHGSQLRPEDQRDSPRLLEEVLEWCRVSLLVQLQLRGRMDKDRLITRLDNALLDPHSFDQLRSVVAEQCEIYSRPTLEKK